MDFNPQASCSHISFSEGKATLSAPSVDLMLYPVEEGHQSAVSRSLLRLKKLNITECAWPGDMRGACAWWKGCPSVSFGLCGCPRLPEL